MMEEAIRRFISEELAGGNVPESITQDYPLLDHQVLDSLGLLQLVTFLETEYSISIVDEELVPANFATVGRIVQMVEAKRTER